jgi:hypothetical protein
MKLRIRFGRAVVRNPRADSPAGKVRVKNKDTGKTTFVSPQTLEDHPERYEAPRKTDRSKQKQERQDKAQKELKRRKTEEDQKKETKEQEDEKRQDEEQQQLEKMTPQQRKDYQRKKQEEKKQKAKEEKDQSEKEKATQERGKTKEELLKKRKERQTKEEEGREKSRVNKERKDTWKEIQNDHPELSPDEQKEREKTFMETGLDSGGRSTKAIRWWLQQHSNMDPATGIPRGPVKETKKLDQKAIQEHFKYGPKPSKKGCAKPLKAVTIGNLTICVDPNMYNLPTK